MKTIHDRSFYYHGAGSPIGGTITHPVEVTLEQHGSTCVPHAGGTASQRSEKINVHDLIRCETAYSHSIGSVRKSSKAWTTLVTSVVEGLEILDIVSADRIVTTLSIEHHRNGYYPKCSFVGSEIDNLRVGGRPISATINHPSLIANTRPEVTDWCSQKDIDDRREDPSWIGYPDRPWTHVPSLIDWATGQSDRILRSEAPQDIKNRFRWIPDAQERHKRGYVLCSLVDEVQGAEPGSNFGHVIDVPDVGRLFLGELLVDNLTFKLTMLRVEFGCRADGNMSFADSSGGGASMP